MVYKNQIPIHLSYSKTTKDIEITTVNIIDITCTAF